MIEIKNVIKKYPAVFPARPTVALNDVSLKLHRGEIVGLFGENGARINALRTAYYDAFADFGRKALRTTAERWQFYYRSHEDAPFTENALTDGYLAFYGKALLCGTTATQYPLAEEARPALEESQRKFSELWQALCQLPTDPYLEQFLKYQTRHMLLLTRWCLSILDGKADSSYLCQLLEARKVLEQGSWRHWHRGDKKINIPMLLELTNKNQKGRS